MSSFGNAPSRQKSIDVEFNLLRTWSTARLDLHHRLARSVAMGVAIILSGAVILPLLISARSAAATNALLAKRELRATKDATRDDEQKAEAALPTVEREAEILSSAKRVESLLSGLSTVLNEAPDRLVVRSLQFDVTSGKLNVKLRAEAPDAETARTFARRVGSARGIEGAKASSISNEGDGVAFNFTSVGVIP